MKNKIIYSLLIILLIGCKSNLSNDVTVKRSLTNYRIFFEDSKTDSIAVHFPYAYTIKNKSRNDIITDIKSKPESFLSEVFMVNKKDELDILPHQKLQSGDSLVVVIFVSKIYKKNDIKQYLPFENFSEYRENFLKSDKTKKQILFTDSAKKYLNEIEKDSIFFEFTNREKNIYFYKVGTLEGKAFFTDDKSNDEKVKALFNN